MCRLIAVIGEVGLSGEIRGVSQINARLKELAKLGFKRAVVPAVGENIVSDLDVIQVKTVSQALDAVFE